MLSFNLQTIFSRWVLYAHLTDEETETLRNLLVCMKSGSHSHWEIDLGFFFFFFLVVKTHNIKLTT